MNQDIMSLEGLYNEIITVIEFDAELSILHSRAAEYARLHLHARKSSGCNSMGEIEHLLDEFRQMIYEIIRYCGQKKYIDDLAIYSIDVSDKEIEKLGAELGEFL